MTTVQDEIVNTARTILRDFPKFFQQPIATSGRTYDLGHPNVVASSLWVGTFTPPDGAVTEITSSGYSLDERNGLLRLNETPTAGDQLLVEGYHYEWISEGDMAFFTTMAIELHSDLPGGASALGSVGRTAIAKYAITQALWSLVMEYSRDIDVATSEAVHIPASERYRMVAALAERYEGEYRKLAQSVNIGPERIQVLTLRRVSRRTERLVPLFRPREIGDVGPIVREFPAIDPLVVTALEAGDELRGDVLLDLDPPESTSYVSVQE